MFSLGIFDTFLYCSRHQINHFVSTLQQYVHSELSHVSWAKLLHSLKHKVGAYVHFTVYLIKIEIFFWPAEMLGYLKLGFFLSSELLSLKLYCYWFDIITYLL